MYVRIIICMICGWNQLTVWDHFPDCCQVFLPQGVWFGTQQLWDVVTGPKLMKLFYQPIFVNFQDLRNNHNHSVGSATARARYNSWQLTRTRKILRVSAVEHRGRVVNSSFFDRSYAKYGDWWLPTVHRFCRKLKCSGVFLCRAASHDVGNSYH